MERSKHTRTYQPDKCVVFFKTSDPFGGLSNMAPGFPLFINDVRIRTAEALYQACRFPHLPAVQHQIIDETSPMTAKMRSKAFRDRSRADWNSVRVSIMRWCLRVKLAQNPTFKELLISTGDLPIVERSSKDAFWGAKQAESGDLVGINCLGRLLMELREGARQNLQLSFDFVEPPPVSEFFLYQKQIEAALSPTMLSETIAAYERRMPTDTESTSSSQPSMFDFDDPPNTRRSSGRAAKTRSH